MKTIIATLLTAAFTLTAVPAFACDGHKTADASEEGEATFTSADAKKDDVKKAEKKKATKKEAKKEEAAKTEGEV